jgi:DNA-binding transcriptional LysR family regulator
MPNWTYAAHGAPLAVPVRPRLAVNTADAAISAAVAGGGITRVLSYQVAAPVAAGTLRLVLGAYAPEPLPVHLVYAAQALLPQKLRAFLDFATPRLKATFTTPSRPKPHHPA